MKKSENCAEVFEAKHADVKPDYESMYYSLKSRIDTREKDIAYTFETVIKSLSAEYKATQNPIDRCELRAALDLAEGLKKRLIKND